MASSGTVFKKAEFCCFMGWALDMLRGTETILLLPLNLFVGLSLLEDSSSEGISNEYRRVGVTKAGVRLPPLFEQLLFLRLRFRPFCSNSEVYELSSIESSCDNGQLKKPFGKHDNKEPRIILPPLAVPKCEGRDCCVLLLSPPTLSLLPPPPPTKRAAR